MPADLEDDTMIKLICEGCLEIGRWTSARKSRWDLPRRTVGGEFLNADNSGVPLHQRNASSSSDAALAVVTIMPVGGIFPRTV